MYNKKGAMELTLNGIYFTLMHVQNLTPFSDFTPLHWVQNKILRSLSHPPGKQNE